MTEIIAWFYLGPAKAFPLLFKWKADSTGHALVESICILLWNPDSGGEALDSFGITTSILPWHYNTKRNSLVTWATQLAGGLLLKKLKYFEFMLNIFEF